MSEDKVSITLRLSPIVKLYMDEARLNLAKKDMRETQEEFIEKAIKQRVERDKILP